MTHANRTSGKSVDRVVPVSQALTHRGVLASTWLADHINAAIHPYEVRLKAMPDGLKITGEELGVDLTHKILTALDELDYGSGHVDPAAAEAAIADVMKFALSHDLSFRLPGLPRPLRPLTLSQLSFMTSLLDPANKFVIGVGSTGTGKTHMAIAAGLNLLQQDAVKSVVITRPRVLAEGEVMTAALRAETEYDNQFVPIEDELRELLGHEEAQRLIKNRKVEITPLGRMRGRTFNDAFVYIDEAQNISVRMLRMALTRTGQRSRLVVTGDVAQIDLTGGEPSGLPHLLDLLKASDLAVVHHFQRQEIIRSDLVCELEALYESAEAQDEPDKRTAA